MDVTAENAPGLIRDASLIVDAADNFETRLIVNDAAVQKGIPFLYGACVGSYGLPPPALTSISALAVPSAPAPIITA